MNFNKCNLFLNKYSIDNFDYKIPKMQEMNQFIQQNLLQEKNKIPSSNQVMLNKVYWNIKSNNYF